MGQHQHGHVAGQRGGNVFGLHQHQLQPALLAQAFGNVQVGGKLLRSLTMRLRAGLSSRAMFSAALSTLYRLMEVLSVHTTSFGPAPIRGELVAQALGQVKPARGVPGLDQVGAPIRA
jgi:hypothetical protein